MAQGRCEPRGGAGFDLLASLATVRCLLCQLITVPSSNRWAASSRDDACPSGTSSTSYLYYIRDSLHQPHKASALDARKGARALPISPIAVAPHLPFGCLHNRDAAGSNVIGLAWMLHSQYSTEKEINYTP